MYSGGSYIDLFNSDPQSELFSGLVPNSVVASDDQNVFTGIGLPAGSVLMGRGALMPTAGTLSGTANQISVTGTPAGFKFELPQDIHIEASPTFKAMILTGQLTANGALSAASVATESLQFDPFEIKVDPTFGLSFFDSSTSEIAVPLSILPADGLLGSAVAIGTKLIVNNDIEFLYGATKQTIGAAMPTDVPESKWTLPDTGLANLTFPALETENKWTNRQIHENDTDATSTTSGSAIFAGGVGIAKSLHAANITTGALTVGGTAVIPGNYVTTNTAQTVTGKKLFTQDVNIGTDKFGRLRFSTYNNGDSFINGGYTEDHDYFLEFFVRGVKTMELRNGYPGSGKDREVTMPGLVRTGRIAPTSGRTHSIGSDTQPYRNLYLGNGTGDISLGHGIRTSGRAELHLHANGDNVSEIMFGTDARIDANIKWVLSSREPSTNNAFRLFRGPKLTGGSFVEILDIIGSGANTGQLKHYPSTDSTSTTTGAAVFTGGVGIAKSLNAARVIVPRGTGAIDAKFVGAQPELFINSDGDGISQLSFGNGPAESANVKWAISSRASGSQNEGLRVYRGPKLAGAWDQILQIDGTGTDVSRVIFNKDFDATSTTSGAVQIRGGLGVAKTLHAKDIKCDTVNTNNLTLTNNLTVNNLTATYNVTANGIIFGAPGQSLLNHYEELWVNNIVFYPTNAGTTTPSTLSADLRVVRIGLNVTIDVRFNGLYTPGFFTATSNTKMRSDIGLPQKFIGSRSPPPATISVINNGNAYVVGVVELGGGNMVVWAGPMGDFNGVCRIPSFSVSYNLYLDDS